MNNDPNNENLYETFVKTADDVANNLKERYKDQWGLNLKYSQGAGESKNYSKIVTQISL